MVLGLQAQGIPAVSTRSSVSRSQNLTERSADPVATFWDDGHRE